MPEAYNQFMDITAKLEKHYKDMQDVEFTIERGKLWMLQTRNAKRTAKAAIKIAMDMANEGLISKEDAVCAFHSPMWIPCSTRSSTMRLESCRKIRRLLCAKGVNASPGAAVGQIYFDADTAERMAKEEKQKPSWFVPSPSRMMCTA
jgi:pyruvate,orthophosphate dikinase